MTTLLVFLLSILSVFMILLILIQRGKGGGLAGAFGGMGGQSAFGTKAGDVFTKITVVIAVIWFILCGSTVFYLKYGNTSKIGKSFSDGNQAASTVPNDSSVPASTPGTETTNTVPNTTTPENTTSPVTPAPAPVTDTAPAVPVPLN